jgi:hypothetical protein
MQRFLPPGLIEVERNEGKIAGFVSADPAARAEARPQAFKAGFRESIKSTSRNAGTMGS